MIILDNFESFLYCFHTYGVRRTIDVLDSENQPGSGSGKIWTEWNMKYELLKQEKKTLSKLSKIFIFIDF